MGVTQAAGFSLRWFRNSSASDRVRRTQMRAMLTSDYARKLPPRRLGSMAFFWAPYLMGERMPTATPMRALPRSVFRHSHSRARNPRHSGGSRVQLRDNFTIFREMIVPVDRIRFGRRRSSLRAVAAGTGRCLWTCRGGRPGRGGRLIRLPATHAQGAVVIEEQAAETQQTARSKGLVVELLRAGVNVNLNGSRLAERIRLHDIGLQGKNRGQVVRGERDIVNLKTAAAGYPNHLPLMVGASKSTVVASMYVESCQR